MDQIAPTISWSIIFNIIGPMVAALATWFIARWRMTSLLLNELKSIHAELKPNGGASLRDAIGRIEERQAIADAMQWAHHEHDTVPVWESDLSGSIQRCNPAFARLLGVSTEDLRGHGWMSMIVEDDLQDVQEKIENAENYGQNLNMDYKAYRWGEMPIKLETRWRRVQNHRGKTVGYVGTVLSHEEVACGS